MATIAFVTWDGAGNLPPALAVAEELVRRGHRVEVLAHESTRALVEAKALSYRPYPTARDWTADRPGNALGLLNLMSDRAMGRDVVEAVDRLDADLVVVDCLLFGVMRALRDEQIPYVVLEHLCDGYLRKAARGPFGVALTAKRHRPMELIDAAVTRMTLTIPELDPGHGPVTHVGPISRGTPSTATEPAVLISLSTYRYPNLHEVWQRVLDAVDGLAARVVATTGPRIDPSTLRVPADVEVHRWVDHRQVLPEMTATVCHGGHGTVTASLAHGLPALAIPLDPAGDQPFMGEVLASLGAGDRLPKRAKPTAIRAAIEALLDDASLRTAARRLADQIQRLDGRQRGADLLEALAVPATAPQA